MISDLVNAGPSPVLEQMMRFTAQRQRILAHNVANIDTPNFQPLDASPRNFQEALAKAVDDRRGRTGGETGELKAFETREVRRDREGQIVLTPTTASSDPMTHDRNNTEVETIMQKLSENGMMFTLASSLWKQQQNILRTAITQRT
jgi:flagellar basal-body rod protein FlgB